MIELISEPWPWWFSGIMIALIMITLIYFGKSFGFSSNLRVICAACGAGKKYDFFNFNWKAQRWNLLFLMGAILGGVLSATVFSTDQPLKLSASTINDLKGLNIYFDGELNPEQLFGTDFLFSVKGFIILLAGGFMVGFGTRWAGGCTSGHGISGLSNLQLPSLIAVIGFFAGGLIMTHLLFPLIF